MLADLSLENRVLSKKALKPAAKRELVAYLTDEFKRSIRQVCRALALSRTFIITSRILRVMSRLYWAYRRPQIATHIMVFQNYFRCYADRGITGTINGSIAIRRKGKQARCWASFQLAVTNRQPSCAT